MSLWVWVLHPYICCNCLHIFRYFLHSSIWDLRPNPTNSKDNNWQLSYAFSIFLLEDFIHLYLRRVLSFFHKSSISWLPRRDIFLILFVTIKTDFTLIINQKSTETRIQIFLQIYQVKHLLLLRNIIFSFGVFHISISQWSFTGVSVTASHLKSPGLFSVFWPFSIMLSFGWFPFGRQLSSPPNPFNNPLITVQKSPITIGTIVTYMFYSFFFNPLAKSRYLSFFSHSFSFILRSAGTAKSTFLQILFFFIDYYKVWSLSSSSSSSSSSSPSLLLLVVVVEVEVVVVVVIVEIVVVVVVVVVVTKLIIKK